MNLSEMLRKHEIEKTGADSETAKKLLAAAGREIAAAEDIIKIRHPDIALSVAYSAMLNAGRALMASMGYRLNSEAHHKGVIAFCAAVLPPASSPLLMAFDRYRIRRHDVVYGEVEEGGVSGGEVKGALEKAREFVALVKGRIK